MIRALRRGRFLVMLGAFMIIGVVSATTVSVGTVTQQARAGIVLGVYFVNSNSLGSTTPVVNTARSTPSLSGSYGVANGALAYLWSPQFASARTVAAGTWVLDLWAAATPSGTAIVWIYVTDSTGVVTTTIAPGVSTPTIGTASAEVVLTVSGSAASIPAGGYLNVVIDSQNFNTLTVYWGAGQATNFQAPLDVLKA